MKKLILLLLTATISVTLMGQSWLENPRELITDTLSFCKKTPSLKALHKQVIFRSNNTLKQRLDSVVSPLDEKYEFSYDSNGNLTQYVFYNWSSSSNAWIASYKREYCYDSNRNLIQAIYYYWNSSSFWVASSKVEYDYDSNGNQAQAIYYNWTSTSNTWMVSDKDKYSYDSNGNRIQELSYNWNSTSNAWEIASSKGEYSYDSNGNQTQVIYYNWSSSSNTWTAFSKGEYSYDSNGNQTQFIFYHCSSNAWSYKREYNYDNNGNETQYVLYDWSSTTNTWVASSKSTEFSYDNTYSFNDLITPKILYNSFVFNNNKLLNFVSYRWDATNSIWVSEGTSNWYYSETNISAVNNATATSLKVNIQSGQLVLTELAEGETLTVYNIQGFAIYNQKATSETISLSLPMHGVYVVKVGSRCVKVVY